jgi:RNA polymerase sigma factor (sigma-70 family)
MTSPAQQTSTYDDTTLYEGLKNNQPSAFEYLYKNNYLAVRQLVFQYKGSDDDAKDIFQEGVIALWNNIRSGSYQLRKDVKMSTYLIQICKLCWIDRLKKASNRYELRQETYLEPVQEAEVEVEWINREEQSVFQRQFGQLGDRCQTLLKHFYFMKQSLQEIAEQLGIGEASAKNEKYRCMQRLKKIVLNQA